MKLLEEIPPALITVTSSFLTPLQLLKLPVTVTQAVADDDPITSAPHALVSGLSCLRSPAYHLYCTGFLGHFLAFVSALPTLLIVPPQVSFNQLSELSCVSSLLLISGISAIQPPPWFRGLSQLVGWILTSLLVFQSMFPTTSYIFLRISAQTLTFKRLKLN